MTDWFDELDLDPGSTWRRMGTRALGDRPWLVADHRRDEELALKADLLRERPDEVLATSPDAAFPGREVLDLVARATGERPPAGADPLERAARSVQEDLCLLRHRDGAWHLDAACVCFPSRWRLADKIGRPLLDVHEPTPGYDPHLAGRVAGLLDHLGDQPVLRRNWFVHPDGSLFQPEEPVADPIVPAADALAGLHLRSERQTLRRLPSGWILFTIRVQQERLEAVLSTPERRATFLHHLREAEPGDLAHRGMTGTQVAELRTALGDEA